VDSFSAVVCVATARRIVPVEAAVSMWDGAFQFHLLILFFILIIIPPEEVYDKEQDWEKP
jgi:hypothetical protein